MLWEAHTATKHVKEQQSLAAFVVVTIFMTFQNNTCDFWGEKFRKNAMSVRITYEDTNKGDCSCQHFTQKHQAIQEGKKKQKETLRLLGLEPRTYRSSV